MKRLLAPLLAMAFCLPPAVEAATYQKNDSSGPSRLSIRLADPSGAVYKEGETVRLTVETGFDAHVLVFNIDTRGYVHLLYPRNPRSIQRTERGDPLDLPAASRDALVVSGPTGMEFVFAVAVEDRDDVNEDEIAFLVEGEDEPEEDRYRIEGDPFLAANRVAGQLVHRIARARGVSIAYTYYYVNDAVDYPRYLCEECAESGEDPYGAEATRYVATDVFSSEADLSYPLARGFVSENEATLAEEDGGNPEVYDDDEDADETTRVYVYYPTWSYYWPSWYPYYYPSGFYFGFSWYWGSGWWWHGWGYPYYCHSYPYYYWRYPYSWYPYGGYAYSGVRGVRHGDVRYRYRTNDLYTAMNHRSKTATVQKSKSLRDTYRGDDRVVSKTRPRPGGKTIGVAKDRQVSKIRPSAKWRDAYSRTRRPSQKVTPGSKRVTSREAVTKRTGRSTQVPKSRDRSYQGNRTGGKAKSESVRPRSKSGSYRGKAQSPSKTSRGYAPSSPSLRKAMGYSSSRKASAGPAHSSSRGTALFKGFGHAKGSGGGSLRSSVGIGRSPSFGSSGKSFAGSSGKSASGGSRGRR